MSRIQNHLVHLGKKKTQIGIIICKMRFGNICLVSFLKLFKSFFQCRNKFYEINQGSLQNASILTLALFVLVTNKENLKLGKIR